MIAILLPLLVPLAAQAPEAPAAPTEVHAHVRADLPRATIALAVPLAEITPAHALLAALLNEPRALPSGEVATLRARSGELTARLTPDGLVVVAEADARDVALAVAAVRAALADAPFDGAGLPGAQARALVALALRRADGRAAFARAAGAAWFGASSPWTRLLFDDVTLLQTSLVDATAARAALGGEVTQGRWFASGRIAPEALAQWSAPSSSSPVAAAPVAFAPPPRQHKPAATLSQTLPLTRAADALAPALAAWVHEASVDAGVQHVRVLQARGARLLVLELAADADPAAVRAALHDARAKLLRARDVERALVLGDAARARNEATNGSWATAGAERSLAGAEHASSVASDGDVLLDLLRRVVMPEIMRAGSPPPPATEPPRRISRSF